MTDALKVIVYKLVYLLAKLVRTTPGPNHLLLVKTDEIGDYMLARNLLPYFKKSGRYKGYKITLVGNSIFRQVFEAYDKDAADEVIWIKKKEFRRNPLYRFRILKQVRKQGATVAVNLVYSRRFRMDDGLVAVSGAPVRIGMVNDEPVPSAERWLTPSSIYTQLLDSGDEMLFDAYRNARFAGQLLQVSIAPVSTAVTVRDAADHFGLPAAYFVVFPGSGIKSKKWPPEHFAAVAAYLVQTYGWTPVLCGSAADKEDALQFIQAFGDGVVDLTGKTSLPQFLSVLKEAHCLVSVDTGSVHLAAAVQCPVFALFSGLHYGRFAPYPKEIAPHFYAVYPDEVEACIREGKQWDPATVPIDSVNKISAARLIAAIKEHLPAIAGQAAPAGRP